MEAQLTFTPDYAFFTLRDPEHDAAVNSAAAIAAARRDVAASTGYEVYVCCAQDRLAVHATVSDSPPSDTTWWQIVHGLRLACPSGELRLGDVTGQATAITLPSGPGPYEVDVYHRSRETAVRRINELRQQSPNGRLNEDDLARHGGVEEYHMYLRPAPESS
ncbi:hypothetical protein QTQ03_27495 [Micromonospora sp. WMMA1363]|uniref:hypothetical protein n=1 Tax=Micromonospora sp. WMMA1363 TaxID=3053985 RepID=UPI00259D11F7|nr:hypothetical protein [Micromonospora sp. WMMA1363]MDM4723164.1 hypothetical protein [Micromonospora sp. WMMA1363]